MNVRNHQIAALSILASGVVVLLVWGRSMATDSDEVRAVRDKFRGKWVATLVQAGENRKVEGKAAENCRAEFDGRNVAFHQLINDINAKGTFFFDKKTAPGQIDFKLDAGWIVGLYEVNDETLTLCLNSLTPPEQLGVPSRPRPRTIRGGEDRHLYIFRKVKSTDRKG